jgi:hypothetical protein
MTHVIDNAKIESNLTMGSFSPTATPTTTTLNGTLVLTNASTFEHFISGTALGYKVQLPNATTLTNGWKFEIFNNSSASLTITYNDTTTYAAILPSSFLVLTLESNTTSNGSWLRWSVYTGGTASGILHYDVSSSTPFTLSTGTADTPITGMTVTPAQGEYSIWYQGSIEITGNNTSVRTTLYKTGVLVSESLRTIRSSVSTFYTTHITSGIVTFNGTDTLEVRVARTANSLTILSRSALMIRLGDGV